MTPYAIYESAQAYWLTQRYPSALAYSVAVSVVEGGKPKVERYASSYDGTTNVVYVDPVSDYEIEHPVKPTGVNIGLFFWQSNKPLPPVDFIGVPRLRPNYTFGMAPFVPAPTPTPFNSAALVDEIRAEHHDPNPRVTPTPMLPPEPRVIDTVFASNRAYAITLVGNEPVDGHDCYHLALKPLRNPGKYRIREAWIDEQNYATWKLVLASNFVWGPATHVGWTIYYGDGDGAHYITREVASAPISHAGEIFSDVVLSFEKLRAADPPRPLFDVRVGEPLDEPEAHL